MCVMGALVCRVSRSGRSVSADWTIIEPKSSAQFKRSSNTASERQPKPPTTTLWLPHHAHPWWQGHGSLGCTLQQSRAAPPPQTHLRFAFRAIRAIQEAWLELLRMPGAWWARLKASCTLPTCVPRCWVGSTLEWQAAVSVRGGIGAPELPNRSSGEDNTPRPGNNLAVPDGHF